MADYDRFADDYDRTFDLAPVRAFVEAPSMFGLLGDVHDQAWLDLACGTGPYTRALKKRGARRVVGVDISAEMLRLAHAAEDARPLGVEYVQQDVGTMPRLGEFDGAIAAYLLHYARDREHLRGMCRSIAANLAPGGRFLTYQLNPAISLEPGFYQPYGTELDLEPGRIPRDGDAFTFRIVLPEFRSPDVTVYYWSHETLETALRDAGFTTVRWRQPTLSPEAGNGPDAQLWHAYLRTPLCVILDCIAAPRIQ
jgi:SAM-dependent methyltransferase